MIIKICRVCQEEKDESEFNKSKINKDGLVGKCKECQKKYKKNHYQKNKEKTKRYNQIYYKQNNNKIKKRVKEYQVENKEKKKEAGKKYREKNKEKMKEYDKQYYKDNKNRINERNRRYYKDNKEKINLCNRKYDTARKKIDPVFKLRKIISARIYQELKKVGTKKGKKGFSILDFLPYTIQQLKQHLETQFEPWMSWKNHGVYEEGKLKWHIDHVVPHSKFYYVTMDCEDFRQCWALSNLRPLEALQNIKKGNRVE